MSKLSEYARPEWERRFVLPELPSDAIDPVVIRDRYIPDTRMRLRQVETPDGQIVQRKLGHKVRPDPNSARLVMHTSIYLDKTEFEALSELAGDDLVKTRYRFEGLPNAAVDVHEEPNPGLILLEIEFTTEAEAKSFSPPQYVGREVTDDESFSGGGLAQH